jgi:hypothetical protein
VFLFRGSGHFLAGGQWAPQALPVSGHGAPVLPRILPSQLLTCSSAFEMNSAVLWQAGTWGPQTCHLAQGCLFGRYSLWREQSSLSVFSKARVLPWNSVKQGRGVFSPEPSMPVASSDDTDVNHSPRMFWEYSRWQVVDLFVGERNSKLRPDLP